MNYKELDLQRLVGEERSKRGWTYDQVAQKVGCSASYVFRVEKGNRKMASFTIVEKLIKAFNLSDQELIKYYNHVSELELKKATLMEKLETINTNNFNEVSLLIQDINQYQELAIAERLKNHQEGEEKNQEVVNISELLNS